jgi:hypothetical protein
MAEISEMWATAYHEAGHCFVATRYADAFGSYARIYLAEDGNWTGDSDVAPTYRVSLTAVAIAVAGIVAEAQERSFKRFNKDAFLRIEGGVVKQLHAYRMKPLAKLTEQEKRGIQLDFWVPDVGQKVEATISFADRNNIPDKYTDSGSLSQQLRSSLELCLDHWRQVRKIARELYEKAPERVTWWRIHELAGD